MRHFKYQIICGLIIIAAFAGMAEADVSMKIETLVQGHLKTVKNENKKGTLAVFPLNSSAELRARRAGFAMSELISRKILELSSFKVTENVTLQDSMEKMGVKWDQPIGSELAVSIGNSAGAHFIMIGNMNLAGEILQVNSQLISVKDPKKPSSAFLEIPYSSFNKMAAAYLVDAPKKTSGENNTSTDALKKTKNRRKKAGYIGLEVYATHIDPSDSDQFKSKGAPSGIFRVWLHEKITVDIGGNYVSGMKTKEKSDGLYEGTLNTATYFGGASYRHDNGQQIVPSFGAGLAYYVLDYDIKDTLQRSGNSSIFAEQTIENTLGYYLGANVAFYFTKNRNWGAFLDGKYTRVRANSPWKENVYYNDGFTSYFYSVQGVEKIKLGGIYLSVGLGLHF